MEALPGLWSLTPLSGLIGVIVVFFLLLSTGRIITKSSHERELAQANKRGDEWKETALQQRAVNQALREQNGQLIEATRTASAFFAAHTPRDALDPTGGGHVSP